MVMAPCDLPVFGVMVTAVTLPAVWVRLLMVKSLDIGVTGAGVTVT